MEITFNNSFIINIDDIHTFDCYYGKEIAIKNINNQITVDINIEALGFSAILVTFYTRNTNNELDMFLTRMNKMTVNPLNQYSSKWKYLLQEMKYISDTELYSIPPVNMSTIPFGLFYFNDTGVGYGRCDTQYSFEMYPIRQHLKYMTMKKFYIDTIPVTCSDYEKYLDATKYEPMDGWNYLKNWNFNNNTKTYSYPKGYGNKPVTYLSLNEARLYCSWMGKRLPHVQEWQYAAQGNLYNYSYPWGNQQLMGINFPMTQHGRTIPGPSDVNAFVPNGNSMFGVSDLIGNVWQYTDEFIDNHTRYVIVKGSSNYRPNVSRWYFPSAYQVNQYNKYFLMDDSYERCGTIGFRCAADSKQPINEKPMFWNGKGNYCVNKNDVNGYLCGRIDTGKGYNNLTEIGQIDWVQFGSNSNDNSEFKMARKQTSIKYITNISAPQSVYYYSNNPQGFYWNDGQDNMQIISIDNASTSGIYITNNSISFGINNLNGGNMYKLRVFVGVYKSKGIMNITLNIGTSDLYIFEDSTVYCSHMTTVCYEINIDLSSVSKESEIQLSTEWSINHFYHSKNVSLQAIALELLTK
eukprot:149348_1